MKWPTLLVNGAFPIFFLILPASLVSATTFSTANISEGCYEFTKATQQLTPGNYELSKITPYNCVMMCAASNHTLAGLTTTAACFCSDELPGNSSPSCGGTTASRMFNLSLVLKNEPKLQFDTTPTFLKNTSYQLSTVSETTSYGYQLTYKVTGLLDEEKTDLEFGQSYFYTPTAWGSDVELTVVVIGKVRQEFKITSDVKAALTVSSIKCPLHVIVGSPITCTGQLDLGKSVNVTWSVDGLSGWLNLADPVSWYIGDPVPRWSTSGPGANLPNGLVISLTTGVTHPIIVHAWEMNVNKSGSLDIVVLRPSCDIGKAYCPTSTSCCEINNEFSSQLCTENTSFCGSTTIGINSENCSSNDPHNPVPLFDTYTPIHTFSFYVTVGYNIKVLTPSQRFEYLPGDILGWIKSSGAAIAVDPNHGEFSVLDTVTSVPNSVVTLTSEQRGKSQRGTVLIAGVASKPTEFTANLPALSSSGEKDIYFKYNTSEKNLTQIHNVTALYSVGNISFTTASNSCAIYGPLNESFNIAVNFDDGTKAQITWKVNNITKRSFPYKTLGDKNETTWHENFTFSQIGEYPLTVLVSNEVSGKLLSGTVIIQEKITGLSAAKANKTKTTYQGLPTELTVSILKGNNVTYKWYFGDGSDVVTATNTTVSHSYHQFGLINTTVEATNMVSSKNYSFLLNVSNPVEITVPPHPTSNVSVNITCRLAENSIQNSHVVVLQVDNDSLVSTNCNTVELVFTPGDHDIHCYIQTVVRLYSNKSFFVFEPISGLLILEIPPIELGKNYTVKTNISTGNDVTYKWQVSGKENSDFSKISQSLITFDKLGRMSVTVNASNIISFDVAKAIVIVQKRIENLNLTPSADPAKTDVEITFNITTTGSEVNYTVNITSASYFTPYFTHTFSDEGIYNIFIVATNLINTDNITYAITVQIPVKLRPVITCPLVTRADKSCVVPTKEQLTFQAELPYATNVTFEWKWKTNHTIRPSNRKGHNITSTQNYTFDDRKIFNISVVAENKVSDLESVLCIETLDKVSNFSIHAPKAVPVNTNFTINASINSGSDVTYSYDLGDNTKFRVTRHKQLIHQYNKAGVYQIRGNASNLVSNDRFSREIIVQHEITGVYIQDIDTLKTNESATLKWNVTGGTNVSSRVNFSDGSHKIKNYPNCHLVKGNSTYICETTHSWSKSGSYQVDIVAINLLSTSKSASVKVVVQDPVEGFKVKINLSSSNQYFTHKAIPLLFTQTKGSDVKYRIYLNDSENRTESTSKNSFDIKYYKEDVYFPWFIAYNDISSLDFKKLGPIEIEKPPEPIPIEGLKISAEPTKFNEKTRFTVSYEKGARFECSIDFGDENKTSISEEELNKVRYYKYKAIGEFTVTLKCWNKEGSKNEKTVETTVYVQEPIEVFTLDNSVVSAIYKKAIEIKFSWQKGSDMKVVAYAEKTKEEVSSTDDFINYEGRTGKIILPKGYFSEPGRYIIRVNASNKVSSLDKPLEMSVNVIEEIEGVKVLFNPYVPVGYGLRAYLNEDRKGSNMDVTWNFGDDSPENITQCAWKTSCFVDHKYTKIGKYVISVIARNGLEKNGSDSDTVKIEHPVFGWKFHSSGISTAGTPSSVKLVYNKSFSFPTEAKYEVIFYREQKELKKLGTKNLTENVTEVSHTFEKPGCYLAKATLKNKVSTVVLETKIKVRGKYSRAIITAKSLNEGHNSGMGLPLEYPVKFESNINNTCLKYNWTITKVSSSSFVNASHSKSFEYTFNDSGKYKINFIAYDNEGNDGKNNKAEEIITVEKSVTGLFLFSDGRTVNINVTFILLWKTVGDNTRFEIDYDDDSGKQELSLDSIINDFGKYREKLFDTKGYKGTIFTHNFTKTGEHEVQITVNGTGQKEIKTRLSIAKAPCPLPIITVTGGSKDASQPPEVPYEVQYSLFSTVKVKGCSNAMLNIDFKWKVFKADEYLLKPKQSFIPPDDNREVKSAKIRTDQSTLVIPRKTLAPALYIFQLNAEFEGGTSQNIRYVRIKRPPLIVEIEGGSARSIPWNKEFVLNASKSVDPLTGRNDGLLFEWECIKKGMEQNRGGCFGAGKELSEKKNKRSAQFREKLLLEGITYEFTVKVSDGKEVGTFTQEINAIPGKPPLLKLSCVSNCGAKVNPEARLSITSECEDNCVGLRYEWTLGSTTASQSTKDIWPSRTLTKQNSPSLVVRAGTFKLKKEYIFKLKVTNDHEKTGFVSYKVETNSPPSDGTCYFYPKNGSAMETSFTFTCQNWIDDDPNAVLFYKVLYFSVDDQQDFLLYHGPSNNVSGLRLPAGPKNFNYSINLTINVEDVFKSFSSKNFTVRVTPVNVSITDLENRTNEINDLISLGDIQAANRLAIALIQGISFKNDTKEESKVENEEKGKLFDKLVENITDNLPEDLDSMRQSIETVVAATSVPRNVSQNAQSKALDAFLRTSEKLKNESKEDLSNDIIEEISNNVMKGIGNMLKTSSRVQADIRDRQEKNQTVPSKETEDIENNVDKAFQAVTAISESILQQKVPNEENVLLKASGDLEASVRRATNNSINENSSVKFSDGNDARIDFPTNFSSVLEVEIVDVVGLFLKDNPYQTLNTSKFVDSSSVSLELKERNGNPIKIANLTNHLTIAVPREVPQFMSRNDNTSVNKTQTKSDELVVHIVELSSQNNAFILEIDSANVTTNVSIYGRQEKAPTLEEYDFSHKFPNISNKHRYFLGNGTITGIKYYIGVKSGVQMNYTFHSHEIGCYYYDEGNKSWTTYGCTPDRKSTTKVVQCLCNHATLFGSNFFVKPNKLDIGKQLSNLANLADYPALLATICVIGGLYAIGMVWALRKDRKKTCKATLHCAADNEPYDNHKYEVTLFTGSRRNAGSTAEVSIIITGDDGDSEPRLLQRTSSVSFKRTSQDSYLVTTAHSLGSLQYIRVWHDNSGPDPSWFLSEVIIRDVETGEQYFFLCNSWLACDEGDGLVERLIPVASPEELKDFQYLFMQNSTDGFSDGHLWFSIVLRPAQSRFTHAQRVTCCLCLLLCTMLVNAMFFRVPVAAENNVDVDVGPYQFTWHEVMVGIQSSLIVFPINLLIVTIFRRIAVRPTKSFKYLKGNKAKKPKKSPTIAISLGDIDMEKSKKKNNPAAQTPNVETQQPTVRMRLLPWWFVFIAWFLVIATSVTAGLFTILYGLQFGKRRQEQWLTALVISVFQDILVSQPIKIFAFSLFVAFVIRKPNNVDVNEENDKLMQDDEWIQESMQKANPDGIVRMKTERKPPDELVLKKMRLFRQKERKMFGVCHEVLQFFFFWWIVLMIAYGHREPDAHILSTSMEKTFLDLSGTSTVFSFKRGSLKHDIYMTKNKKDLLMWVREVIIPGLYHEKWYNNMTDKRDNLISDGVGYLIGSPRLRLLRNKKDACDVAKEFKGKFDGCETEYSFSSEYQEKYNSINWGPSNSSTPGEVWEYKTQSELYERPFWANLATYRGGGYVLKLSKKMDEALEQIKEINKTLWIDGETRAVFVEFALFYPGKNLHCIITILFECPASGGCTATSQIQATRLDELIGNYRIFVLACELIFVLSIAIFTYKTCKDIVRQGAKFWYQFWNWIELCTISIGWTCLAFYILRFIANKWTKAKFNDNPESFVSFRYVATADQLYGVVIAFLVFLTSIKFVRLFRFNRRMSLLGSTLKYAAWDMFNFFILFAVAFIACVSIAYLLFQTNIDMFSSILSTTETLLNIILGKFKYMNLNHDTFLASAVVLAVYCVVVVFILMNVFLVILNDAFKVVKGDNDLQENEYEIVDYMTSRFRSWLGFRVRPSPLVSDFENEYGFKPTYVQPVKKKYQVPATAILDRKLQELLDFVDKQAYRDDMENMRVDQFEDETTKKKALLLLMS